MIFELTENICAEILFAMENQQNFYALDAAALKVVQCDSEQVDEENLYSLPDWSSADGYNLLESFVSKYKGLKASNELKLILAEGRGVFRNFKNCLKKYPEVDKRFHVYKDKEMKACVYEWYNALRESWGLEVLDQDFYEYDDLVQEDFIFRAYNHLMDGEYAAFEAGAFLEELKQQYPGLKGQSVSFLMEKAVNTFSENLNEENGDGFVCRTLSDEFAGCILYSYCKSNNQKSAVVSGIFVNQNYRGLGIAAQLLERSISDLTKNGIQFLFISNSIVPQLLKSVLTRLGFTETDFSFVLELN